MPGTAPRLPDRPRASRVVAMIAAALDLTVAAWGIFPCHWAGSKAKSPLTLHGHLDASRDPDQIKHWWTRWPYAMIGAPCPTRCLVIDIDPRNGGRPRRARNTRRATASHADRMVGSQRRRPAPLLPASSGPLTSTRLPKASTSRSTGTASCRHPSIRQPVSRTGGRSTGRSRCRTGCGSCYAPRRSQSRHSPATRRTVPG